MAGYVRSHTQIVRRKQHLTLQQTGSMPDPQPNDSIATTGGSLVGTTMPGWRRRIRQHYSAVTNLDATKTEIMDAPGKAQVIQIVKSTGLVGTYAAAAGAPAGGNVSSVPIGVISTEKATNMAAGEFYKNVRNKMSTFKGSVFAAEFREAKSMMIDRSRRIISSIDPYQRQLKRRWYGKGSKRSRLKLLSDSWLELQFGWLPLISDIEDAHKALNNPRPQYAHVVGSGSDFIIVSRGQVSSGSGIIVHRGSQTESTECEVKYYGQVRAYANPAGGGPMQDFGLHAREFLPTAWEVLPWSFAVDYFTNVGDIVNAIAYAGSNVQWAGKVTTCSREVKRETHMYGVADTATLMYVTTLSLPFISRVKSSSVARRNEFSVPIPSLLWGIPSRKQFLNLAALAVSRRLRLFNL